MRASPLTTPLLLLTLAMLTLVGCPSESVSPSPVEDCTNGVDDDGDGLIDCADPLCSAWPQCRAPQREVCNNGVDDDGDKQIDCADADCADTFWCAVAGEDCANGLDDDGDGLIDCADSSCAETATCKIGGEDCANRTDDDGDGLVDCDDPACQEVFLCLAKLEICDSGQDDDGDGLTDCDDPDCANTSTCKAGGEDCTNGADDDGDGMVDCADADCAFTRACLILAEDCQNGVDDNGDGLTDCADAQCAGLGVCQISSVACLADDSGRVDCANPLCANIFTCLEICDNDMDDNGDGRADCDDPQCEGLSVCQAGPSCGDGILQTAGNESCDDGPLNGQYDRCNATCTGPGPRCGDGITQANDGEACDAGADNGVYGSDCNADCTGPSPRCGDGIIQADAGEVCDGTTLLASARCMDGQVGNVSCDASCRLSFQACIRVQAVRVAVGEDHSCSQAPNGAISCWGGNDYGQLAVQAPLRRPTPATIPNTANSLSIAAGGYHTCRLTITGEVQCWGRNLHGQLGHSSAMMNSASSAPVMGLGGVAVSIAAGLHHTCALLTSGQVKCWGDNSSGKLGDGSTTERPSPVLVPGLNEVHAIFAGRNHNCAIQGANRQLYCWGENGFGQLGDGSSMNQSLPVFAGITDVIGGAGGESHTCVRVNPSGQVYCWGGNNLGQVGDGSTLTRPLPTPVMDAVGPLQSIQLTAGQNHTCALRNGGSGLCWGDNSTGQLGSGLSPLSHSPSPLQIDDTLADGLTSISAGRAHTCVSNSSANKWCFGSAGFGQLGNGTTSPDQNVPVPVSTP